MNVKALTGNYRNLTAWERAALFLAAHLRGDELEAKRLIQSSPRNLEGQPICWPIAQGYFHLANLVLQDALAFASQAMFCRFLCLQNEIDRLTSEAQQETEGDASMLTDAADIWAERFCRTIDSWEAYCESKAFPPRAWWEKLTSYVGFDLIENTLATTRKPHDEIQAMLERRDADLRTHDDLLAELNETVNLWARRAH